MPLNLKSEDPDEIRRMWYIPPAPPSKRGWLLFTRDYVLAVLQGCRGYPERIKPGPHWTILAALVLAAMAICQAVLMLLARVPILGTLYYMLAKAAPRNIAGFFLRGCYWKARLKRLGQDTLIDQGVEFNGPVRVSIGSDCHIDRYAIISGGSDAGEVVVGDYVLIGPYSHIAGRGGVTIGDYAALMAGVHIYSVTNVPSHPERSGQLTSMSHTPPETNQSHRAGQVTIDSYALVGYASLLLPDTRIGLGSLVHAFSKVSGHFPDFAILSGHGPAKQTGWRRPPRIDPLVARNDGEVP